MHASLLVAAPDSTTRMRQAADLVVDPAAGDPAAQINQLTAAKRLPADLADGTYATRSPLVHRTAAGFRGDGASVVVRPASGFVGEAAIVDEEGAHLGELAGFRIECGARCAGVAFRAGGPYSGEPNTSPDSHHRIRGVDVFYPKGGVGITSGPGTDGIRGGSIVDCLIVKGAIVWQGSDVWVDDVTCRDSPIPAEIGGGSSRVGTLKAFYSTGPAAVRLSGSRTDATLIHAQDAGRDGLVVAAADVTVRHFTGDSCGRLSPGDGLVIAAPRAVVSARLVDRGQTPTSPMRNGARLDSAAGAVLDLYVSGVSGVPVAGATSSVASLRVNGVWRIGGPTGGGGAVDLAPLEQRIAELGALVAGLTGRVDGVAGQVDALAEADDAVVQSIAALAAARDAAEQRRAAAAATLADLDTQIAKISANAPQMRVAMEHAARTLRAALGA